VVSIVCAILFTLFESPHDNRDPLSNLYLPEKFIETHTVSVLIWSFLGQVSGLLSSNYPSSIALAGLSMGFYGLGGIQLLYLNITALKGYWRAKVDGRFQSAQHLQHFYFLCIVFAYALSGLLICTTYGKNHSVQASPDTPLYAAVAMKIVHIVLIYSLQILPVQFYKLSSELKQEALQNRLNLIGYLSHEMRTPLNTAYLGLDYINTELRGVQNKLATISKDLTLTDDSKVGGVQKIYNDQVSMETEVSLRIQNCLSDLLSAEQLDDMLATSCHVLSSCQTASQTLTDLLTVDKIGDGKLTIKPEACNPWSFIRSSMGPFTIDAAEKNILFVCDCNDKTSVTPVGNVTESSEDFHGVDDCYISIDKFKFNQVLRNLLSNALKFTPREGKVTLMAEVTNHDPKTSKVFSITNNATFSRVLRVSVTDNGPGIRKEDQALLFGKYVQFDAAKLQKGKGSGLGLWISKNIVSLHGGVLEAVSEGLGHGCTFYFDLPLYKRTSSKALEVDLESDLRGWGVRFKDVRYNVSENDGNILSDQSLLPDSLPSFSYSIKSKNWKSKSMNTVVPAGSDFDVEDECNVLESIHAETYCDETQSITAVLREINTARTENRAAANTSLLEGRSWSKGLRILVVDDSMPSRKVMRSLLSKLGHTVTEAVDGGDFLCVMGYSLQRSNSSLPGYTITRRSDHHNPSYSEHRVPPRLDCQITSFHNSNNNINSSSNNINNSLKSQQHIFDIILIDDNMPVMNGSDAVYLLRQEGYLGRILGISGDVDVASIQRFKDKGVDDVLCKPIDLDILRKRIELLLLRKD